MEPFFQSDRLWPAGHRQPQIMIIPDLEINSVFADFVDQCRTVMADHTATSAPVPDESLHLTVQAIGFPGRGHIDTATRARLIAALERELATAAATRGCVRRSSTSSRRSTDPDVGTTSLRQRDPPLQPTYRTDDQKGNLRGRDRYRARPAARRRSRRRGPAHRQTTTRPDRTPLTSRAALGHADRRGQGRRDLMAKPQAPVPNIFSRRSSPFETLHFPHLLGTAPRTPAAALAGDALREIRIGHNLGPRAFARKLRLHPELLGTMEAGSRPQSPTLVAWILGTLDIDPASAHRILTHVENASPHLVTDHHTHTIAAQCYEHIANHTIEWAPIQLPDLLRTSEHDDLLFQHPLVDTDYADHQRQTLPSRRDALITNPDSSHTFLIGDAALLTCPQPARAGQLILLRTLSHHANITVRIVPINRCSPGLATPFTLYHRDDTAIAVAAHHDHAGTYTSARDILARSADTAAWLTDNALDQAETSHALALPDDQPSPVP